jgi:catechol 2,3-dioxygenase-like lactoylglutathione lyase family enzyme
MTPSSSLTGILQVAITVTEIDRATAFYRDALGLPVLMTAPNMAFFNCGGVRLYLSSGQGPEHTGGNSFLYFKTPDINAFLTGAKAKAITIHQEPNVIARMPDHDLWLMWIKDSEGNLLGIMEERRR